MIKGNRELIRQHEWERQRQEKWDRRFLGLAQHIATWSRDPSTQVGAAIVNPNHSIVSLGFNGFPMGVKDSDCRYNDRDFKLKVIVHAELNALSFAQRDLSGCTLYTWPFMPCCRCAGVVIQHQIKRVVAPVTPEPLLERWKEDLEITRMLFGEAGVELKLYEVER